MQCLACGTELPSDQIGAFPCPGCGRFVRRTRLDAANERWAAKKERPLPGAWAWLPGLCLATALGAITAAWLAKASDLRGEEVGWTITLILPLCMGAQCGYVSRGFMRSTAILAGTLVVAGGLAYLARSGLF
jgi:predicted outer membrane lipoprotein